MGRVRLWSPEPAEGDDDDQQPLSVQRGGRGRGGRGRGRGRAAGASDAPVEEEPWLQRVRKQVEFYFSDANLRKDAWFQKRSQENDGFIELSDILRFSRMQVLRCRYHSQLVQAIRKSTMLVLNADKTAVKRDFDKAPIKEIDPLPNTVYVEGIPLVFTVDDAYQFFKRYGTVCYVDMPLQRETREPLGFCFVEFAQPQQAAAAISALEGTWPPAWPTRYDGKTLRVMMQKEWLHLRSEYRAHKATSSSAETASSSAAPPKAASSWMPKVARGCVVKLTGFSQPQTVISIKQFAEHAVVVEYCDYHPGAPVAHLRLQSPDDCAALLKEMRVSRRLLGWREPQAVILDGDAEDRYWEEVSHVRALRSRAEVDSTAAEKAAVVDASSLQVSEDAETRTTPLTASAKRRKRRMQLLKRVAINPQGVVRHGPADRVSKVDVWRKARPLDPNEEPNRGSASFTDTVCGSVGHVQPGFSRSQRVRRGPDGAFRVVVPKLPKPRDGEESEPIGAPNLKRLRTEDKIDAATKGTKRAQHSDEMQRAKAKKGARSPRIPPPSPAPLAFSNKSTEMLIPPPSPIAEPNLLAEKPKSPSLPRGSRSTAVHNKGVVLPPESPYNDPFMNEEEDGDAPAASPADPHGEAGEQEVRAEPSPAKDSMLDDMEDILDLF
mmetsp:Transcript_53274/g.98499  ORF Transcript_53274/g.98499 Transcript_53274/m.98499 type:complete len:663 (-) Transcript_53274:36-2024(-)